MLLRSHLAISLFLIALTSLPCSTVRWDWVTLQKMPQELREYVDKAIAYSPIINENAEIISSFKEGRSLQPIEYTYTKIDKTQSLHLVLCELQIEASTVLTRQERSMTHTVSPSDVEYMETEEASTATEIEVTSSEGPPEPSTTTEIEVTSIPEAPATSIPTTNANPQASTDIVQESEAICLYFNEYTFNGAPVYTLQKLESRVLGPQRRAIVKLIGIMKQNDFTHKKFVSSAFLELKTLDEEKKDQINDLQKRIKNFPKGAAVVPILFNEIGSIFETNGECAIVYQVSNDRLRNEYLAVGFKRGKDTEKLKVIQTKLFKLSAAEYAKNTIESIPVASNTTLRASGNSSLRSSSGTTSPLSNSSQELLPPSSSSNKMSLKRIFKNTLKVFSSTKNLDLDNIRTQILNELVLDLGDEIGAASIDIVDTLRPAGKNINTPNSENVAVFLCRYTNVADSKYFLAVVDNATVANSPIRLLPGYYTMPTSAVIVAETYLADCLSWSTEQTVVQSEFNRQLISNIGTELNERLEGAKLGKIQELLDSQSDTIGEKWTSILKADTIFVLENAEKVSVRVLQLQKTGIRPLFVAVLNQKVKGQSTLKNSQEGSSGKLKKKAFSPFYCHLATILNRTMIEFEAIYKSGSTKVVVAADVHHTKWWQTESDKITKQIQDELEYMPYPMQISGTLIISVNFQLHQALLESSANEPAQTIPGVSVIYLLCDVKCGLEGAYRKHFTAVVEKRDAYTLRLVQPYHSTMFECCSDAMEFPNNYLMWEPCTRTNYPPDILESLGKVLRAGLLHAELIQNCLEKKLKKIRPGRQVILPPTREESLQELSNWDVQVKSAFDGNDVLVYKSKNECKFALLLYRTSTSQARLTSFFKNVSSIRNLPRYEFMGTNEGYFEHNTIWRNELIYTPNSPTQTYFNEGGANEMEKGIKNFFRQTLKRTVPQSLVLKQYGMRGSIQIPESDDLFFLYEVTWDFAKQWCLLQLKEQDGSKLPEIRNVARVFRTEDEAKDWATFKDEIEKYKG